MHCTCSLISKYFSISNFSDEKKRQLYDEYGSFGLYIAEQVGDDLVGSVMFFQSGWFKVSSE